MGYIFSLHYEKLLRDLIVFLKKILFASNLYIQRGTQAYNSEIKSRLRRRLSQRARAPY